MHRTAPHNKEYLAQNVNSVAIEKAWQECNRSELKKKKICCCLLNKKEQKEGQEELEKKGNKRDGWWWQRRWENQRHEDIGNQDVLFLVPPLQLTGSVTLANYRLFKTHFPYF